MSNEGKNIKDYNNYLIGFIILNIVICICASFGKVFVPEPLYEPYIMLLIEQGIVLLVLSVITFILNGSISSDNKARLVFWKIKNPYPGSRSFTNFANKDVRINKKTLRDKYGELPTEPNAQNDLWYQIFKKDQYDHMIFDSHRTFLIFRDLTGLSFLFLILSPITIFITKFVLNIEFNWWWVYIGYLMIQYIFISKIGQDRGNRFVCNVLAKASIT